MAEKPTIIIDLLKEEKMHFFEALEREVDFQQEYKKLEQMVIYEHSKYESVELWLEANFREWKKRGTYFTMMELRRHLGFTYDEDNLHANDIDISKYFLYCEMILNLFWGLQREFRSPFIEKQQKDIVKTMDAVIEKSGCEKQQVDDTFIIVQKNAAAFVVADKVPELANMIIQYNHYLLRGDLEAKKLILKQIADALEAKRKILDGLCKDQTKNYFELVNNMNVRHNNLDPVDKGNYNAVFASYTLNQQEAWYDLIYEQALMLFMHLEQQERNERIKEYKQARASIRADS